jgi:hypothetical protein
MQGGYSPDNFEAPFEIFNAVRNANLQNIDDIVLWDDASQAYKISFRIPDEDTKYRIISLSLSEGTPLAGDSNVNNYAGNVSLHLKTMDKLTLYNSSRNLLEPSKTLLSNSDPVEINVSEHNKNNYSPAIADTRGKLRQTIGIFTTPIFGALRRFVVWGDQNYGSCDISLAVAARGLEANTGINDNFNAEEEE